MNSFTRVKSPDILNIIQVYTDRELESILETLAPYYEEKEYAYKSFEQFINRIIIPQTEKAEASMVQLGLFTALTERQSKLLTNDIKTTSGMQKYILQLSLNLGLHTFFNNLDAPYSLKSIKGIKNTLKKLTRGIPDKTLSKLLLAIVGADGFMPAMVLLDKTEK